MSTKPNKSKATLDLVEILRVGIAKVESGGSKNPYTATSPDGEAYGKYQFRRNYWWDTNHPIKGIKQFAKGKEDIYGKISSFEDFKNNQALQEAYFTYYAQEFAIPTAQKAIAKGNPLNLTLDQATALIHFKGSGKGAEIISTGKVEGKTDTNISDLGYLDTFNSAVSDAGYSSVKPDAYISAREKEGFTPSPEERKILKSREERKAEYIKRDKAIDSMAEDGVDVATMENLRKDLWKEIARNGDQEIYDEYRSSTNEKVSKESAAHEQLLDVFAGAESVWRDPVGKEKKPFLQQIKTRTGTREEMEAIKENFPDLAPYIHIKDEGGEYRIIVNRKPAGHTTPGREVTDFINKFENINKEFYGDDYKGQMAVPSTESFTSDPLNFGQSAMRTLEGLKSLSQGYGELKGTFQVNGPQQTSKATILPDVNWKSIEQEIASEKAAETATEETETSKEDTSATDKAKDAIRNAPRPEQEEVEEPNQASAYFERMLEADRITKKSMDKATYDAGQMKQELPFDAVTGLALGFMGNEQAKAAKIPLRTEHISQAVQNYTADLAKRSKAGLPVEMEAAMANQLAESYQGGLKNIANGSGGNSAVVLGNQGALEVAKNRGLVDIQLADFEAKEKAFQQYGQALQYMNDFDARRDIANHGIKYQEAKTKQLDGKNLATAGFAQLTEALQYQRENGPGSANHMYKSALLTEMFGFNPLMKDDGSGTVEGTRSHWLKLKEDAELNADQTRAYSEKYNSLSPEAQKEADKRYRENPTKKGLYNYIDSVSSYSNQSTQQRGLIGASENLTKVIDGDYDGEAVKSIYDRRRQRDSYVPQDPDMSIEARRRAAAVTDELFKNNTGMSDEVLDRIESEREEDLNRDGGLYHLMQ